MSEYSLDFPFAYSGPLGCADFRAEPEDFVVDEELGFCPSGEGEHLLLHIRKRNLNTRWVAGQLAEIAGIKPVDVGYCGMKDRRAVTSQWFSLYLPKKGLDLGAVAAIEGVALLASGRHNRKLRRGDHQANRFKIRLRNCSAPSADLESRLSSIAANGVPNYFGEQRFGHGGNNLTEFQKQFVDQQEIGQARGRNRRRGHKGKGRGGDTGIILSAGRSYLFNRVLATRVEQGNWNKPLPGEESATGPMWGRGRSQGNELEQQVVDALPGWCNALEHSGLAQERRALALQPQQLSWLFDGDGLVLEFALIPGCFATSVLRELTLLNAPSAVTS